MSVRNVSCRHVLDLMASSTRHTNTSNGGTGYIQSPIIPVQMTQSEQEVDVAAQLYRLMQREITNGAWGIDHGFNPGFKNFKIDFVDEGLDEQEKKVEIEVTYNDKGDVVREWCNKEEMYEYYRERFDVLVSEKRITNVYKHGDCEWDRNQSIELSRYE